MIQDDAPVPPWWDDFMFLDDDEAWAQALVRAAASEPEVLYEKSDEEREQDRKDWQSYQDQLREEDREISTRAAGTRRALAGLRRLTRGQQKKRERFVLYCPATPRPCRLYVAYAWTPPTKAGIGTRDTLLVVASTQNSKRAAFPSWGLTSDRIDPDQWLPVGCSHGKGRFPVGVPGEILHGYYTADTPWHSRRISDLLGVSSVLWSAATHNVSL